MTILSASGSKNHRGIGFLILVLVTASTFFLGRYFHIDIKGIESYLGKFPLLLGAFLYILLYVLVTFFIFFSKDIFWLSGALFFGPVLSALLICIAEIINAFILFFMARYLGRGYVEKKVSAKYSRLDEKLGRISFLWLFIFRAAPLIPYRFLDIAAGLTRLDFKKYLAAVILGTPVKMFWIQHILYGVGKNILRNPNTLAEYFLNNKGLLSFSLIYLVLVAAVIFKMNKKE